MISIHQSQFLPWVPYFYKIFKSDIFTVLDDVQFQKNGVQNRNTIKTPRGALWFTMPVKSEFGAPINKIEVASISIYPKLLKTLEINYKRSIFFDDVYTFVKDIFEEKFQNLHVLNRKLMEAILKALKIKTKAYFSSAIPIKGRKDDLLIEVIKNFDENEYLSGKGALNYMELDKFKKAGIKVYVFDFRYTEYRQLWNKQVGFLPDLSIIDLLFNNLEDARGYILGNGTIKRII